MNVDERGRGGDSNDHRLYMSEKGVPHHQK